MGTERKRPNRLPNKEVKNSSRRTGRPGGMRDTRDLALFKDYCSGLTASELADKYNLAKVSVYKVVYRVSETHALPIPPRTERFRRQRMKRRAELYRERLEYLTSLSERQKKTSRVRQEIIQKEIFVRHVEESASVDELVEFYGMPKMSIELIIKRLSK